MTYSDEDYARIRETRNRFRADTLRDLGRYVKVRRSRGKIVDPEQIEHALDWLIEAAIEVRPSDHEYNDALEAMITLLEAFWIVVVQVGPRKLLFISRVPRDEHSAYTFYRPLLTLQAKSASDARALSGIRKESAVVSIEETEVEATIRRLRGRFHQLVLSLLAADNDSRIGRDDYEVIEGYLKWLENAAISVAPDDIEYNTALRITNGLVTRQLTELVELSPSTFQLISKEGLWIIQSSGRFVFSSGPRGAILTIRARSTRDANYLSGVHEPKLQTAGPDVLRRLPSAVDIKDEDRLVNPRFFASSAEPEVDLAEPRIREGVDFATDVMNEALDFLGEPPEPTAVGSSLLDHPLGSQ